VILWHHPFTLPLEKPSVWYVKLFPGPKEHFGRERYMDVQKEKKKKTGGIEWIASEG